MELHKKIKENRIQEICDEYIDKSVKGNKPISEKDVASLSCTELVVLYYNTEWLVERLQGESINTGLENQIMLMDLIKERVKTSTLYVIHTDATNLPFLTENKSILVYTEKRFADMVACSFNVEYFKESTRFRALEVSGNKETYWNKLRAAGINTISVDGTKFTVKTDDLVENKEYHKNTEFCRFLIQHAQAIRLGINRDKTPIFREAILSKLKENPLIIYGSVIKKGENEFIPVYVNASAMYDSAGISNIKIGNFHAVCSEIFDNKNITGIVLNPQREHIVIPSDTISEAFAHLSKNGRTNSGKSTVKCNKCHKIWSADKLNINGICPECIKKEREERDSSKRWVVCKGCGIAWPHTKLNDDDLCPNCVRRLQAGENPSKVFISHKKQNCRSERVNSSSGEKIQSTDTVDKKHTNPISDRTDTANKPQQEDYATRCLMWAILSVFVYFFFIIALSNASKAIKQAKANGEAVSSKVWIGVAISVIHILLFTLFVLLPIFLS